MTLSSIISYWLKQSIWLRIARSGGCWLPVALCALMPRLHQDTCCKDTCILDEQLVSGYTYVDGYMSTDTSCLFGIHVDCISATLLLFIYVVVDLQLMGDNFVANTRSVGRRRHVDTTFVQVDTTCIWQHVSWCKHGFSGAGEKWWWWQRVAGLETTTLRWPSPCGMTVSTQSTWMLHTCHCRQVLQ